MRLLVGTEEWVVPSSNGYSPRWQDLCDPAKRCALARHTVGARCQSVRASHYSCVAEARSLSVCNNLGCNGLLYERSRLFKTCLPGDTMFEVESNDAAAHREWIVSSDGRVSIEMDVTAQNRGQACLGFCCVRRSIADMQEPPHAVGHQMQRANAAPMSTQSA